MAEKKISKAALDETCRRIERSFNASMALLLKRAEAQRRKANKKPAGGKQKGGNQQ